MSLQALEFGDAVELVSMATYLETEDIIAEKNIYKNRKVKKWILTKTARFQFHYNTSHP